MTQNFKRGDECMKILFAADISFNHIKKPAEGKALDRIFEETKKSFAAADFSVLNLENVFGQRESYTPIVKDGPNLISEDGFIEYIDELNPTVLGMANNHAGDYGDEAMFHTIDVLKKNGYKVIGVGGNIDEAYEPAIFEKDGVKVAVFAICENEYGIATKTKAGAAGLVLYKLFQAIQAAKKRGELPIVYFHGGNEENPFPSPEKVGLYRTMIDFGAKAVIAMHTHCPQGYEYYNGGFIAYSMGNFYFPSPGESCKKTWWYGYMCLLEITSSKVQANIIPYSFVEAKHTLLAGEELSKFLQYMEKLNAVISNEEQLKKYFDSWCIIRGKNAYLSGVEYTPETMENSPESMRLLKNIFCCEAHNELIKNTLKILFEQRCEEAQNLISEIQSFQKMEV